MKQRVAIPLAGGGELYVCVDPRKLTLAKWRKLQDLGERLLRRPDLEESSAAAWRRWTVAR